VTTAREPNSYLLRALKAAFEIEDGQNYDVVLTAARDSAFQAGGSAATIDYEMIYTLGYKIQNIGELQLEFFQPAVAAQSGVQNPSQKGRDPAPLSARQERVRFADGQHDSPGALGPILGELLLKPVVEFLKTFGVPALGRLGVRAHLRPLPQRIQKGKFWFLRKSD
jgi:hypothetical protein